MAIATLSTLGIRHFAGNAHLFGEASADLVGQLNTIINKVNEVINGFATGVIGALQIGTTEGTYYGGAHDSFFEVDGVNPPRSYKQQMIDQDLGTWRTLHVASGVLVVT